MACVASAFHISTCPPALADLLSLLDAHWREDPSHIKSGFKKCSVYHHLISRRDPFCMKKRGACDEAVISSGAEEGKDYRQGVILFGSLARLLKW